jgi:hypothetical protein
MADGKVSVPGLDDVDPQLGQHTDATPRVAATDGGRLAPEVAEQVTDEEIDARAERDVVDETDERPEECSCGPTTVGEPLPCFECWMAGFETPADGNEE